MIDSRPFRRGVGIWVLSEGCYLYRAFLYIIVNNFLCSKQSCFASLINNSTYTNHFYSIYPNAFTHIETYIISSL